MFPFNHRHFWGIDGRCMRCGMIVGTFDAMTAGRYLRDGQNVRVQSWPAGQYLGLHEGKPAFFLNGVVDLDWDGPTTYDLMDVWEIYSPPENETT